MPIRLAIVDDDQVLARTLMQELETFPDVTNFRLANSGLTFVSDLKLKGDLLPDVVLWIFPWEQ
jgi:hypothetical protein